MSGTDPGENASGSAGSSQASTTRRVKKMRWNDSGGLEDYWEDVPIAVPTPAKPKVNPLELYKELKFDEDVTIGSIIPGLKDTTFDAVTLKNTAMIWLAKDISATKTAGLWLETDVEFRGILQPIADVLSDVFKQEKPKIHLAAHLGIEQSLGGNGGEEVKAKDFTLRGSIPGINCGFGDFLMFRDAGIRLEVTPDKVGDLQTMWGFYGTVHLKIPNSITPLVLQYELQPNDETLDISMGFGEGELWRGVFGVSGLDLKEVTFTTSIQRSNIKGSLEFSLSATWSLGGIPVVMTGGISDGEKREATLDPIPLSEDLIIEDLGNGFLRGTVPSITFDEIRNLFATMTGGEQLEHVSQDIRLNDLVIEIKEGRLRLSGEVWVDAYRVACAEILVGVDGVIISGAIDDLDIGEGVYVKQARLELVVGRISRDRTTTKPDSHTPVKPQGSGTPVTAIVRGQVNFQHGDINLDFDVAAALIKPASGDLQYFVYGQLNAQNLTIGTLLSNPDVKEDHPLNLNLNRVTLIACSSDNVADFGLNAANYPTKSGVFLCAELASLPYIEDLSKSAKQQDRYVLCAGYSKATGLSIRIVLPDNLRIELSPTVVSGPLTLIVDTKPTLSIAFNAVLWLKPEGQIDPLELSLRLKADVEAAEGMAQMKGWWVNPLGLSHRLQIGPELLLSAAIDYKQFAASGTPTTLGLKAGFKVDNVDEYFVAVALGTNPKETLVKLDATRLEGKQIINLVNAVADIEIPAPREDFIRFEDVHIYASPLGCILGDTVYPAGFVAQGKAFIMGKKVEIDCRVNVEGLKLKGEIEGFSLGPLTVKGGKRVDGSQAENALIDFEITKERQHFEVSGSIMLWDAELSVFVLAEIRPQPQLEFNFQLSWSDLIRFQVDGKMIKPSSDIEKAELTNIDDADFYLHAVMEQRILEEISTAMRRWFTSAQQSVHEGIDSAKCKLDEAQAAFVAKVEEAEKSVEETKEKFNKAMEVAQANLRAKQDDLESKRVENELLMRAEEKRADEEIRQKNADLDRVQKAFEDDMGSKKRDLEQKRRDGADAIDTKIRELEETRASFQRDFGNAIQAISDAEARVCNEEWRVREAQNRVDQAKRDFDDCAWYETPWMACRVAAFEAERWIMQCALDAACLILRGAKWFVESVAYSAAMVLVDGAQMALNGARSVWNAAISTAQAALDGVTALHAVGIGIAKDAVIIANQAALKIKQAALAAYNLALSVAQGLIDIAIQGVAVVQKGIEAVAFNAALALLDVVKKDTTLIDIAKGALDVAETVAQTALAAGAWLADRLCDTLNIQLVEISGSLKAITNGTGTLSIRVKGIVFGQSFDFTASWTPANTLAFVIGLCKELWDLFADNMVELFTGSKA